jgi:hypothetical protein
VYILSPISLYVGRFTSYSSFAAATTASAWSPMTSGVVPRTDKSRYAVLVPVAFYCRPVLLSLQEVSDDGGGVKAFSGDGSVGFVFSLLEKPGWLLSSWVAFVARCFEVTSGACGVRSHTLSEDGRWPSFARAFSV